MEWGEMEWGDNGVGRNGVGRNGVGRNGVGRNGKALISIANFCRFFHGIYKFIRGWSGGVTLLGFLQKRI